MFFRFSVPLLLAVPSCCLQISLIVFPVLGLLSTFCFLLLLFSLYVFLPLSLFTEALFTRHTGKDKGQVSRGIRKLTQIFGP